MALLSAEMIDDVSRGPKQEIPESLDMMTKQPPQKGVSIEVQFVGQQEEAKVKQSVKISKRRNPIKKLLRVFTRKRKSKAPKAPALSQQTEALATTEKKPTESPVDVAKTSSFGNDAVIKTESQSKVASSPNTTTEKKPTESPVDVAKTSSVGSDAGIKPESQSEVALSPNTTTEKKPTESPVDVAKTSSVGNDAVIKTESQSEVALSPNTPPPSEKKMGFRASHMRRKRLLVEGASDAGKDLEESLDNKVIEVVEKDTAMKSKERSDVTLKTRGSGNVGEETTVELVEHQRDSKKEQLTGPIQSLTAQEPKPEEENRDDDSTNTREKDCNKDDMSSKAFAEEQSLFDIGQLMNCFG
jgi:hypothetical protein